MGIFDFAMKMEEDGARFYRDMAEKSEDAGVKHILTQLASDEDKHYEIFRRMSERDSPGMDETTVLSDARSVFENLSASDLKLDGEQVEIYRQAVEIEAQSAALYIEKAGEVEGEQRELLLRIADEEKRHQHPLENMVEFLARPDQWIEDAEFNKLEDY